MLIGAHVKTTGGPASALERAVAIGAETAQIFLTPPQQWRSSKIEAVQAEGFQEAHAAVGSIPVFVHGIYLINLATDDEAHLKRSTSSLKSAMTSCGQLGIKGVIFHLGSHKGQGLDAVFDQICQACLEVLDVTPPEVLLILENSAGAGDNIGSKFADLGRILRQVDQDRVKVCLDTQHSYAAGYDLGGAEGLELAMSEFEQEVGFDQLAAVHANDSKVELGSGRDRHENIGQGHIGIDGFRRIMAHKAFRDVPFLLEVPGPDKKGPDEANVNILKQLRAEVGADS